MTTSTIKPIHVVLPVAVEGYYRFGDLPRLIADALYPEHPDAGDEAQELQWMKHAIDGVERFRKDLEHAAELADGDKGYLHVVENTASRRTLEIRMGAVLDSGLVHLDWLNDWGKSRKPPYAFLTASAREPQADKPVYHFPMYDRLEPRTEWRGGRLADTDIFTLEEAASMATKHAGEPVTIGDFLRAAGRGEIALRAIVHRAAKVRKHDGGVLFNKGESNENIVPAGAIPTLPLTACQHLAATGRASWRTFDSFEAIDGTRRRYTKGMLTDDEPDFETVPDDCRVVGYDVRALADAFIDAECEEPQAEELAPSRPDTAMLATPDRLIEAFGSMSGMNRAWFRSMKDRPALQEAVIIPGKKGRNGYPAMLDVFRVMQYLIGPKRNGKKMREDTGWRLLEGHFPKVYATYEACDPRERD
ncbi:hypothetical protein [Ottowia caeni]|uniref:hypothetical protein n=1 Tax=Ottowia caeni TaxID=2870339 RepID=UPI001E387E70